MTIPKSKLPAVHVENPLRPGPYVDAYFGIHANTRRRRLEAGELPPPDRWIGGRPYWFENTIRAVGAQDPAATRLKADLPPPLRRASS